MKISINRVRVCESRLQKPKDAQVKQVTVNHGQRFVRLYDGQTLLCGHSSKTLHMPVNGANMHTQRGCTKAAC